jgi:hypothetical protein
MEICPACQISEGSAGRLCLLQRRLTTTYLAPVGAEADIWLRTALILGPVTGRKGVCKQLTDVTQNHTELRRKR